MEDPRLDVDRSEAASDEIRLGVVGDAQGISPMSVLSVLALTRGTPDDVI